MKNIFKNMLGIVKKRSTDVVRMPSYLYNPFECENRLKFANLMFLNICELMTDLCGSVRWKNTANVNIFEFSAFSTFFDIYGKYTLNLLYKQGYAVIAYPQDKSYFRILKENEYTKTTTENGDLRVILKDNLLSCYVMQSQTMFLEGMSDRQMLKPYLELLDNVLNGSNTISKRLGAVVVMSPQQPANVPTAFNLSPEDKKELEKAIGSEYGYLAGQRGVMVLPNSMNINTINLASLDNKMLERVRVAVLAICDRIHVPANQVAFIDANSSKSLANGSELLEGDMIKYRNFKRLINQTFWLMSQELGIKADYTIENEPKKD